MSRMIDVEGKLRPCVMSRMIDVEGKLRPCAVRFTQGGEYVYAFFHKWTDEGKAITELLDGHVAIVCPEFIQFLDRRYDDGLVRRYDSDKDRGENNE